jgi:hypothetical protein
MQNNYPYSPGIVKSNLLHDAITATVAVDDAKPEQVAGAKSIVIQFIEGGTVNNRSGLLQVYGTCDGTNWVLLNLLVDNLANTESQNLTRVASKTRATAGSDLLALDPAIVGALKEIKAAVTITDAALPTGNFSVVVNAKY